MTQRNGRGAGDLRVVDIRRGTAPHAEGSCTVRFGRTEVLCTASVEAGVPDWRRGRGLGWVTAEYSMLPRATHTRTRRERAQLGGRTQEIQRLIGRSLRATIDFAALGENSIVIDCDVLVADGGTRTASITGAAVALRDACDWLVREGRITANPMTRLVAAVSVGIVAGEPRLDLEYVEDVAADTDMNLVALEDGGLVEVQGTAERNPFTRAEMDRLIDLGLAGIDRLFEHQRTALRP